MVKRIAIFASGTGTNFSALQSAIGQRKIPAEIVLLVCDQANAPVIERAEAVGVPVFVINYKNFATKAAAETAILTSLRAHQVAAILLAGYMRIVGKTLLTAYPHRIINLHPALLPKFPGRQGIADAFAAGVSETGVTVHFIDAGIDTGQIIRQQRVPVAPNDTLTSLTERIHRAEHDLYPEVLAELIATKKI
ncbi:MULTISPECIES: phosphoribosylglycinamide formyltransferase [Levilactobacillus]|uniref:phosphoribosylglycinamide formyltransferase n=1 Tax=Levilactobacillus TaxID=2767886 RepID=UPI0019526C71|nr:phosphoribosylglycinamide formyltransferase [Levilactobacillus sp. 244-2]